MVKAEVGVCECGVEAREEGGVVGFDGLCETYDV